MTPDRLAAATSRVAKTASEVWPEFRAAFQAYGNELFARCVKTDDPDEVKRVQGMARMAIKLDEMFEQVDKDNRNG